jgi:hypothetical protein
MPMMRTVSISELTPGSILVSPLFDRNFKKLLGCGVRVDQQFINGLRQRGITEVQIECIPEEVVDDLDKDTVPVQRCGGCRSVIEIRPPAPNLKATIWRCNKCGQIYFGSNEPSAELRGLTLADRSTGNPFSMDAETSLLKPTILPENAQRLTKSLTQEEDNWADRRRHKRYPISMPVVSLPLADDFRATGTAVPMTTTNVSLGGAALLHTRFVDAPYLALDFTVGGVEFLQVVFKLLRCRNLGPVYEIGGEFISRLS